MSRDDDLWRKAGQTLRNQSSEIATLKAERDELVKALEQCTLELEEAANIVGGVGYSGASSIFLKAVEKHRATITRIKASS